MTDRPGEGYLQRQNDWLRSYFGARSGEPIHELAPELVAALILESDRPETMALQHTFPWSSGLMTIAAAVGNIGTAQIINPTNSGLLVVVQGAKVTAKATGGGVMRITLDGALIGAGQAPNISLDSRARVVAGQPVVASLNAISNATAGTNGVIVDQFTTPTQLAGEDAESGLLKVRPVILTPGHRLNIWDTTPNEAANFILWGYERPIESTELVNR